MTILSSIDIGTNSTRLLIAEKKSDASIFSLRMEERITRLGEGLGRQGYLSEEAINRVLQALKEYMKLIDDYKVQQVSMVATSAAREGSNKKFFLSAIQEKTGISCRIISGEEEAKLTFLGVISDLKEYPNLLICDVGGGSTEFIMLKDNKIIQKKSVPIGSRRLTEMFFHHNPVTEEEKNALIHYVNTRLPSSLTNSLHCVLVGGTAATLAMMDCALPFFDEKKVHHYELVYSSIQHIVQSLSKFSIKERKALTGLHPERADVILAGAMVTEVILKRFRFPSAIVSIRDLLFGLMV